MKKDPRLTFGLIVLNGEPFTKYWLRSVYPWAHEIIVVEGATPHAVDSATLDGHSSDGTLEVIRECMAEEDPEKKITLITAEDRGYQNGFWPGEKTEMSKAFAEKATGDFLVTLGVDEFFLEKDYHKIIEILTTGCTHISFKSLDFWGDVKYCVETFWLIRNFREIDRIMKWGFGYQYIEHRPPTVIDDCGVDQRRKSHISGDKMANNSIYLYHFSHLFPKQVINKSRYYSNTGMYNLTSMDRWAQESFLSLKHPYRVHNVYRHISWLKRYDGEVPQQILKMIMDIKEGMHDIEYRSNEDVEELLNKFWYSKTVIFLKAWANFTVTPFGKLLYRIANSTYIRLPKSLRFLEPPF